MRKLNRKSYIFYIFVSSTVFPTLLSRATLGDVNFATGVSRFTSGYFNAFPDRSHSWKYLCSFAFSADGESGPYRWSWRVWTRDCRTVYSQWQLAPSSRGWSLDQSHTLLPCSPVNCKSNDLSTFNKMDNFQLQNQFSITESVRFCDVIQMLKIYCLTVRNRGLCQVKIPTPNPKKLAPTIKHINDFR